MTTATLTATRKRTTLTRPSTIDTIEPTEDRQLDRMIALRDLSESMNGADAAAVWELARLIGSGKGAAAVKALMGVK